MSKDLEREWKFYVKDMIQFCEKVVEYTKGLTKDEFISSDLIFDATLRNLELVGESATNIPEEVRSSSREIPWRMIVATRNKLIHGYLGIDSDTVWSIIQDDIPELLVSLKDLNNK